jgi:hypothetical protein
VRRRWRGRERERVPCAHQFSGLVIITIPATAITIPVTQLRHSVFSEENNKCKLRAEVSFGVDGMEVESLTALPASYFQEGKIEGRETRKFFFLPATYFRKFKDREFSEFIFSSRFR